MPFYKVRMTRTRQVVESAETMVEAASWEDVHQVVARLSQDRATWTDTAIPADFGPTVPVDIERQAEDIECPRCLHRWAYTGERNAVDVVDSFRDDGCPKCP